MLFRLSAAMLTLMVALLSSPALAAEAFSGELTYKITLPPEMESEKSMFPAEMKMFVDGQKTRIEQSMIFGSQVVISDVATGKSHLLMDMGGHKIRVDTDAEDDAAAAKPKVEHVPGKRNIAGYACRKAQMTMPDGTKTTVWYTDQLPAVHKDYAAVGGFPLEFATSQGGMVVTLTVSDIKKGAVDASKFTPAQGYQIMTLEEGIMTLEEWAKMEGM